MAHSSSSDSSFNMTQYRAPALQQPHRAREAIQDAYAGKIPPLLGFYLGITAVPVARLVATLGYDVVWIDWEHSACGVETMTSIVETISFMSEGKTMPFVRLPGHQHQDAAYALDAGASVVFPQVDTVEQAKHCLAATKYGRTNNGTRSAPPFRLLPGFTDGRVDPSKTLFENQNRQAAVIIQIESPEGIDNLDDILTQVPDIDAVWIGTIDLRVSMGLEDPWGNEPEFLEAIAKYESVLRKHDKPGSGIVQGSPETMKYLSRGRAFMLVASDVQAMMSQKQALVDARALMPKITSYDATKKTENEVYLLPRGKEEASRLDEQHRYIVQLCEGRILSPQIPVDKLSAVIDVGTGSGAWLLDLQSRLQDVPHGDKPRVYQGFDISAAQYPELTESQKKCMSFGVHDARKPFPEEHIGKYDLVHVRLFQWVLKVHEIEQVVNNLTTLLKPGGYIAWDEAAYDDSREVSGIPEAIRLHDIVVDLMIQRQLSTTMPTHLREAFAKSGLDMCHSIKYSSLQVPELQAATDKVIGDGAVSVLVNEVQKHSDGLDGATTNEGLIKEMKSIIDVYPKLHELGMQWQCCLQSIVGRKPEEPALTNGGRTNGLVDVGNLDTNGTQTNGVHKSGHGGETKNHVNSSQHNGAGDSQTQSSVDADLEQVSDSRDIEELVRTTMVALNRYRTNYRDDWTFPEAVSKLRPTLERQIRNKEAIQLVLPAFPFKSSNKTVKVLGVLPDDAERISLLHLEGLCKSLEDAAKVPVQLTIISDGLIYNDLLGVSDEEVWQYTEAVRAMAEAQDCTHIKFSRIGALLQKPVDGPTTLEEYLDIAGEFRDCIVKQNLDVKFDPTELIRSNPDVKSVYLGYKRFLDLEAQSMLNKNSSSSRADMKALIARSMISRGHAYASAIRLAFPDCVRLSIHDSSDTTKVSISLMPLASGLSMTPWHGTLVRAVNGDVTMSHARSVSALTHELIFEDGRPSYFRERSDLFSWSGLDLSFTYLYPTGVMVRPARPHSQYALKDVDMLKLRALSEQCSPVILRGFQDTAVKEHFVAKANELGTTLSWKDDLIMVVEDVKNRDANTNVTISSEAMPMHYDGMFSLVTTTDENGQEVIRSDAPRFQLFVCESTDAQAKDGLTLFASSRLFSQYLPSRYPITELSNIMWNCESGGYFDHKVPNLPLVVPHPTKGTPCVRWHEPWPKNQTKYGAASITIANGDQRLVQLIDSLLYDQRVCLRFGWETGDVLVSDNMEMLHTRTAFEGQRPRQLWRIHVN